MNRAADSAPGERLGRRRRAGRRAGTRCGSRDGTRATWSRNRARGRPLRRRARQRTRPSRAAADRPPTCEACVRAPSGGVPAELAHGALFADLAGARHPAGGAQPGHTGGALHARARVAARGAAPPLAEFSTLTYVARVATDGRHDRAGRRLWGRGLPGGSRALDLGCACSRRTAVPDVLASGLSNVNLVLHPPGAILGRGVGGGNRRRLHASTGGHDPRRAQGEAPAGRGAARGRAQPSGTPAGLLEEMTAIGPVDTVRRAAATGRRGPRRRGQPEDPGPRLARAPLLPRGLRFRPRLPFIASGRDRRGRGPRRCCPSSRSPRSCWVPRCHGGVVVRPTRRAIAGRTQSALRFEHRSRRTAPAPQEIRWLSPSTSSRPPSTSGRTDRRRHPPRSGSTAFAADALGDAAHVELPDVSMTASAGEACGEPESTKWVSDLYAAADGAVVELNDAGRRRPRPVRNLDPFGRGWVCSGSDSPARQTAFLDPRRLTTP